MIKKNSDKEDGDVISERITLKRNDAGVFAGAAPLFPVTANDAGSFDVSQHRSGNFPGESTHFLVAAILGAHLGIRKYWKSNAGRASPSSPFRGPRTRPGFSLIGAPGPGYSGRIRAFSLFTVFPSLSLLPS